MPSGRVHNAINAVAYVAAVGVYGYAATHGHKLELQGVLASSLAFVAGTIWLSPDMDLAEQNVFSKRAWGWFGVLWSPYGWLMSHRGLSHSWIVGPLTRLVYLALLLAVPAYLTRAQWWPFWVGLSPETLLAATLGYYVSQWLHLLADGVAPDFELRKRRGGLF